MDSGSKHNKNDDTSTKYVVDYYKKFSGNRELPKYFSGSPVSYLPRIDDDSTPEPPVIRDSNPLVNIDNETAPTQQSLDTSRASSAMSNRKLEWDNGADIGYENIMDVKVLRKSISLPVITNVKRDDINMEVMLPQEERARSEGSSDSNVKVIVLSFSSSSGGHSPQTENIYSSSSSSQSAKIKYLSSTSNTGDKALSNNNSGATSPSSQRTSSNKIAEFASSLSYFKKRIGLPWAHSTPKYLEFRKSDPDLCPGTLLKHNLEADDVIKIVKSKSDEDVQNIRPESSRKSSPNIIEILPVSAGKTDHNNKTKDVDSTKAQTKSYKTSKTVNLALTKPITVECMCSPKVEKKSTPKASKHASIGIQTDTLSERELIRIIHNSQKLNNNQSLVCFEYSESDKTNNSGTQTSGSPCDSFQYYKNPSRKDGVSSDDNKVSVHGTVPTIENKTNEEQAIIKTSASNSNTGQQSARSNNESSLQSCSDDICLGDVISASQLQNVGDSVENNIHLLHRLLKSKKYDPITKKRYIKKIVQKLTESKYFDESSNSSDLFRPKKTSVKDLPPPPKSENTDTSDEKLQKGVVQVNLPLYFALNDNIKVTPRKRKFAVKTFMQDFLPKDINKSSEQPSSPPEIIPVDLKDTKKNCFTLTNNEFSVKRDRPNEERTDEAKNCKTSTDTSLEKQYKSSSTPRSENYNNWREDKTLSEKRLEEKTGTIYGEGDCVVKFAEKERAYQINWINNEISHLGKLKGLLEKPKFDEPTQKVKKTTTVYTVSEEHNRSFNTSVKFRRNYVIQTNLGTDSTVPVKFNLMGNKYSVTDLNRKCSTTKMPCGMVVGDIEVESSDSTTNIKITTFCETCRRSPCTCVCLKCKKCPCNCNKLKTAVCRICYTIPCICQSTSSAKPHAHHCPLDDDLCWRCNKQPCQCTSRASTLSGKTICLSCHKAPCICAKKSSGRGILSKTCLSCGQYPCIYGKSKTSTLSDEFAGTFVMACPPISAIKGALGRKYSTFPLSLKEEDERKDCSECPICKLCPCVCDLLKRNLGTKYKASTSNLQDYCIICRQCPCNCEDACRICERYPCICELLKNRFHKECSTCGRCPCNCDTLKSKIERNCSTCGICPCICEALTTFTSKLNKKCLICGKCPCICCEISQPKIEKRCSVCGKRPCICETIRREYLTRSTSVSGRASSKSLIYCPMCTECPCICEKSKTSLPQIERCAICGHCPCLCQQIKNDYLTKSTSISAKSSRNCSVCRKCPCICDALKKNRLARSTSVSLKSLSLCSLCGKCPCVCILPKKTYNETCTSVSLKSLGLCSLCGKCPCICTTSETVKSPTRSRSGSLKKVFENCHCSVQTNCTCDFVEKLMQCFNKANQVEPSRSNLLKSCKSGSLQTDCDKCDCQHVSIQTQIDTRNEILQTAKCFAECATSTIAQTDQCCESVGVQAVNMCLTKQVDVCGDGITQMDFLSSDEKEMIRGKTKVQRKKSVCETKVDASCTCEVSHGTQTPCDKRVMLTCSSQSDGFRTVSPTDRMYDCSHSAGISRLKKCKSSKKHCKCGTEARRKLQPQTTVITEEFESKTEGYCSDGKHVVSSKSSSVLTTSYNATVDSTDPSSSKTGSIICICCKGKYPSEEISMIGNATQNFPLCTCCLQRRPILTSHCYAGPEHICTCYKPVKNDILQEIKSTVQELYDLDFCTCSSPTRSKHSDYCAHCKLRLKNTTKTKNGIAYTLTLEDRCPVKEKPKRQRRKAPSLEEIRIRVPCPYTRKVHKDKINLCRQDGDKSGFTVGYLERVRKSPDRKCPRVKVVCGKTKKSKRSNLTLQDYLRKNKPDFIDSAEIRRKTLYSSRSERELKKDEAKLRFFEDNRCHCDKLKKDNTKLFTEHEMKAITRRNYAKLPEVQQRNSEQREKRLRNADKFIVDVFSTKIRNCALKGKKNFPLGQNVVSLPKA